VPITVLSRCQRFDLRRVDAAMLVKHLQRIAAKESISAEPDALALIARAAEGSVRDALSLLDQAIAHAGIASVAGETPVRAEDVQRMLGLADRTRVIELFDALMRADIGRALAELRDQYDIGADPATVLGDIAEFTHFVTRVKVVPATADDVSLSEVERTRGRTLAQKLSMRVLARSWQMLLKGIAEVEAAARPLAAAEMALVRIAYAADLPTPDEVIRSLGDIRGNGTGSNSAARSEQPPPRSDLASRPEASRGMRPPGSSMTAVSLAEPTARDEIANPVRMLKSFEDLIALAAEKRDLTLKSALERDVRLVRFEDGRLEIGLEPSAGKMLVGELSKKISDWTGRRWMVVVSAETGVPSVRAQTEQRKAELKNDVRGDPLVQAVLSRFPGAEIVDVRPPASAVPLDDLPYDPASESGRIDDEP
jgi:DNA polymerase III subunit gamma/tau